MDLPVLEIRGLKKSYGNDTVLSDLDLKIHKGSVVCIIGPNGSGKTTLFKTILGITDHDKGSADLLIQGRPGFLIDDLLPFEKLSLSENIKAFSLIMDKKMTKRQKNEIISVSFCEKIKDKKYHKLSSGQKRKALFALSLLEDPEILILDEPLNSLDLKERIDIISSIKYLSGSLHKTILVSSHDLSSLSELCDTFCFLKGGRIIKTLDKVSSTPDKLNSLFLELYSGEL